jgi:hypothetical protein
VRLLIPRGQRLRRAFTLEEQLIFNQAIDRPLDSAVRR